MTTTREERAEALTIAEATTRLDAATERHRLCLDEVCQLREEVAATESRIAATSAAGDPDDELVEHHARLRDLRQREADAGEVLKAREAAVAGARAERARSSLWEHWSEWERRRTAVEAAAKRLTECVRDAQAAVDEIGEHLAFREQRLGLTISAKRAIGPSVEIPTYAMPPAAAALHDHGRFKQLIERLRDVARLLGVAA